MLYFCFFLCRCVVMFILPLQHVKRDIIVVNIFFN